MSIGPEKLLEVWFSASPNALPGGTDTQGLKTVPAEVWKDMLDLVNCKVLSIVTSDHVDAYLLSESSMFVFPHKLILKTCGTTTLLSGLPRILEIAQTVAGFPHISGNLDTGLPSCATPHRVFYSRKNFLFPERQKGPHRCWRDEVRSLDLLFRSGSAYMIGKMNGEHWYLYITTPNALLTPPATPPPEGTQTKHLDIPYSQAEILCRGVDLEFQDDETLEILMTDLDQDNAKQFYLNHASAVAEGRFFEQAHQARKDTQEGSGSLRLWEPSEGTFNVFNDTASYNAEFASEKDSAIPEELTTEGHALGTIVSEASGLTEIYPTSKYPEAKLDAYLFTPCGFSANGVIPAPQGTTRATHYFTVHVTPEPVCSYASFETNVPCKQTGRETIQLIEQVVNIFKPGRFSVTIFEAKRSIEEGIAGIEEIEKAGNGKGPGMDNIQHYRRIERIVHDLEGYDLVFRYYERNDFEGGGPRIGEFY